MAVFSMAGSNPALPTYPLQRSVRLRSSASAYFTRTPASAGNRQIFTISFWFKRGLISTLDLFTGNNANGFVCAFRSDNTLYLYDLGAGTGGFQIWSARVFRDPSAWYHIVIAVDTTQATDTNRIKVYINGVQENLATWNLGAGASRYPSLNANFDWNNTNQHKIGYANTYAYYDGYLTEFNNVSGLQLAPTSFGAYNSYGVWSPAKYTGTYGTNGFYLNFQDNSALTTTANVGIGKDSSGNGNYWTSNNISITAGVTYDSMLDVPTLTSSTNANFAVMNPLSIMGSGNTLTNGNLTFSGNGSSNIITTGTFGVSSGKWYVEATITNGTGGVGFGIAKDTEPRGSATVGNTAGSWGYNSSTGGIANNSSNISTGATYTTGDVIAFALDMDAGTLVFYKNNSAQGSTVTGLSGTFTIAVSGYLSTVNINCGQRPFSYTPPTGFNRLCTYNLPDSIVPVGAQYFAATLWTGNSAVRSITNTVNGFSLQPDFVWVKCRSTGYNHALFDTVRGANKALFSSSTSAEISPSASGGVSSFNSNGFSLQIGTVDWNQVNNNADTYVGWQWRASNASAVTNTSGTITSSVSANTTSGFSVVTYTGTGVNGATVGHGLGVAPSMVFYKTRSNSNDGCVFHASLGGTQRLILFSTASGNLAAATDSTFFNNTAPSSTVLTLGTRSHVNDSSGTWTYVAYCFAAVPGYSKFGSYTGNGSTDGPFVYLGFRPRWVMVKRTDSTENWYVHDSARDTYNQVNSVLYPNLSNAEGASNANMDFTSNGFKIRESGTASNASGGTYIYAAFAENPFKNALAR